MLFDSTPSLPAEDPDLGSPRSCDACALARACDVNSLDLACRRELQRLMQALGPFARGAYLFREGDPFHAITAVHSGTVKTFVVDAAGREHVLGFFQAGEVIGLNAIHAARYPCNAMALDPVTLCSAPFPAVAALATRAGDLQVQLFRLLSHGIRKAARMAGDYRADERLAAFLLDLWQHRAATGCGSPCLDLVMSRADIANYLRLATETVSRVMQRFQHDGLLRVNRRRIELLDLARLEALAGATSLT